MSSYLRSMRSIVLICLMPICLKAVKYEWGIVPRLDMAFDTRHCVGTDDGAIILYPAPPDYDSTSTCQNNGCDINAHEHFGMTPVVSRVFFKISDFNVKECKLNAYLETDFTGAIDTAGSSVNTAGLLKLRQAYFKACWPQTTFLVGNADHPLYVTDCRPNTVNFNGGMPIASYARYPQFRLEHFWRELVFGVTAYSEFLFQSFGPIGYSRTYIRHGMAPGLCLTLEWQRENAVAGLLFNVWRLQPAVYTSPTTDATKKYATCETISSMIGSAWLGFKIRDLQINNQVIVGQNGPAFNTLGGYAVSCYNETTGACTYANINFMGMWSDWDYKKYKTLTPGFFIGITKSLGSHNQPVYLSPTTHVPTFYGFDDNLDMVFRFAPRITTKFHNITVGFEVDYSNAWFGSMDSCGKHPYTSPIDSVRVLLETHAVF